MTVFMFLLRVCLLSILYNSFAKAWFLKYMIIPHTISWISSFIVQCQEQYPYTVHTDHNDYSLGLLPLGRVPPGFLVGEGARDWAIRHGIHSVSSEKLVSDKAVKLYKVSNRYKEKEMWWVTRYLEKSTDWLTISLVWQTEK